MEEKIWLRLLCRPGVRCPKTESSWPLTVCGNNLRSSDYFRTFALMILIDTHAHIYSDNFRNDSEAMISRAGTEGVSHILMPAIDKESHEAMLGIEARHGNEPVQCLAMMGVHPCSITADFENELSLARQYFEDRKFIAVGETGLDFYWDTTYTKEQYIAFKRQLEWALEFDLPIVIHSRNSTNECIDTVKEYQQGKLKGVFHCFSGDEEQAKKIVDLGMYLGIGGVLTFKNSGLDKGIANISMEHIVLETDAPYLAPVPFRGKRNEPSYLKYVVDKLAEIKGASKEEIAAVTTANARKLFNV
jgi:TatD DNase family protein